MADILVKTRAAGSNGEGGSNSGGQPESLWVSISFGRSGSSRSSRHGSVPPYSVELTLNGFERLNSSINEPCGRHDSVKYPSSSFFDGKKILDSADAGKTRL